EQAVADVATVIDDLDGEGHVRVAGRDALLRTQIGEGIVVVVVDGVLGVGFTLGGCGISQEHVGTVLADIIQNAIHVVRRQPPAPIAIAEVAANMQPFDPFGWRRLRRLVLVVLFVLGVLLLLVVFLLGLFGRPGLLAG